MNKGFTSFRRVNTIFVSVKLPHREAHTTVIHKVCSRANHLGLPRAIFVLFRTYDTSLFACKKKKMTPLLWLLAVSSD